MQNRAPQFWTLGGLSLGDLLRRTLRESWQDEVFGHCGRMAFYQFLAIFPALLIGLTFVTHVPHLSAHLSSSLRDVSAQLFPSRVAQLFETEVTDFSARPRLGLRLLSVAVAAVWAAHNGTWAMIYGLNRAYEVEERRSWWNLTVTIVLLTAGMTVTAAMALLLIFCSDALRASGSTVLLRAAEWLILSIALSCSFLLLYRFAPDLRQHSVRWSTPGVLCALILWLGSTFGAHVYFDHINNYNRTYGPLNGVVMLLLWLYFSNGALLIGGELNCEIQKAESKTADLSEEHAPSAKVDRKQR